MRILSFWVGKKTPSLAKKIVALSLSLMLLSPTALNAEEGANDKTNTGQIISGVALGISGVGLAISLVATTPGGIFGSDKVGYWAAATAASGIALLLNSDTNSKTEAEDLTEGEEASAGGGGGSSSGSSGTDSSSVDTCAVAQEQVATMDAETGAQVLATMGCSDSSGTSSGTDTGTTSGDNNNNNGDGGDDETNICDLAENKDLILCTGEDEYNTQIDAIEDKLKSGEIALPEGSKLEDVLSNLDASLAAARRLAQNGFGNGKGGSDGSGSSSGSSSLAGDKGGAAGNGGGNIADAKSGDAKNSTSLIGKKAYKKHGLAMVDEDGRELTLFERATRAYQGTQEGVTTGRRAQALARIEQTRSEALKKRELAKNDSKKGDKISQLTTLKSNDTKAAVKPVEKPATDSPVVQTSLKTTN